MANCSLVEGSLRIIADNSKLACKLANLLLSVTRTWRYDITPAMDVEEADDTTAVVKFDGTGRSSFEQNLEYLGWWLENSDRTPENLFALAELKQYGFTLQFKYQEVEFDRHFIARGNVDLEHKADTFLSKLKITAEGREVYDYTVEDFLAVFKGYSEKEARELLGFDDGEVD